MSKSYNNSDDASLIRCEIVNLGSDNAVRFVTTPRHQKSQSHSRVMLINVIDILNDDDHCYGLKL